MLGRLRSSPRPSLPPPPPLPFSTSCRALVHNPPPPPPLLARAPCALAAARMACVLSARGACLERQGGSNVFQFHHCHRCLAMLCRVGCLTATLQPAVHPRGATAVEPRGAGQHAANCCWCTHNVGCQYVRVGGRGVGPLGGAGVRCAWAVGQASLRPVAGKRRARVLRRQRAACPAANPSAVRVVCGGVRMAGGLHWWAAAWQHHYPASIRVVRSGPRTAAVAVAVAAAAVHACSRGAVSTGARLRPFAASLSIQKVLSLHPPSLRKEQSEPPTPAGSQHSGQPTVKLHVSPLAWNVLWGRGGTGSQDAAAGFYLVSALFLVGTRVVVVTVWSARVGVAVVGQAHAAVENGLARPPRHRGPNPLRRCRSN